MLGPYLLARQSQASGVVLAVSGGPDSTSLMHFSARMASFGTMVPVVVATVDHGLRPEAHQEAETVAGWARKLGLTHRILVWHGSKPTTRIQEIAREERYRLLIDLAQEVGASHILTGHTLDDQAETVLMRLLRGSGVTGLAGMKAETSRQGIVIARPWLSFSKRRLVATCTAEAWPFLNDPSNSNMSFARVRLRHLLPMLEQEGLTPERLATFSRRMARAEEALSAQAEAAFTQSLMESRPDLLVLNGQVLQREPHEIVVRVILKAIEHVLGQNQAWKPPRLEPVEDLATHLRGANLEQGCFSRNLAGALLRMHPDGRLTITPEPPRRRGRHQESVKSVIDDAAAPPHSLGKAGRHA